MRYNELILRLSDGEYFLIIGEAPNSSGTRWKARPANDRTNARAIELGMDEFQILAAPKKPFIAAVLSVCDKDGQEQPWFFKDYDTKAQAAQDGANDLGLRPGESYMVAQHRLFGDGWSLINVAWYIVSDDRDNTPRRPIVKATKGKTWQPSLLQ